MSPKDDITDGAPKNAREELVDDSSGWEVCLFEHGGLFSLLTVGTVSHKTAAHYSGPYTNTQPEKSGIYSTEGQQQTLGA